MSAIRKPEWLEEAMQNLEVFFSQYVATALWSSCDEQDDPLDSLFDINDLAADTRDEMYADCMEFYVANQQLIDSDLGAEQAGHDFWLTRNGHGAGFWDGDWKDKGQELTKAAEAYGTYTLYIGDDLKIHGALNETY